MEFNNKNKKRIKAEFVHLDKTPEKPCRWLKNRLEYGTFWTMVFFIGLMEGLRIK